MPSDRGPLLSAIRLIGSALVDSRDERLGRVDDIVVRLTDAGYPPLMGLQATIGGRRLFVPRDAIGALEPGHIRLAGDTLNLLRFDRRSGEVLLRADVLGRRLIDVSAGRLVHVHDLGLARIAGTWRLVGVDATRRRPWNRPAAAGGDRAGAALIDWSDVQPFVGHVPTARLLLPLRALRRLHPAQIADIVEVASHDQGEEILSAVEADPELEADVFEELDAHHQVEFLGSKSDQEAAELLAEMAPDDAADLITEVDQPRRRKLVDLLPDEQRRKVTSLLAYNPSTAGGMMSPDFVSVTADASVGEALRAVQTSPADLPTQAASVVFALDGEGRLEGSLSVVDLLRAPTDTAIRGVLDEPAAARLQVGDALDEVAQTMSDYNLTAAPVVDPQGRVVGVVTADDLIEAMIPRDWRRRRIASSDD